MRPFAPPLPNPNNGLSFFCRTPRPAVRDRIQPGARGGAQAPPAHCFRAQAAESVMDLLKPLIALLAIVNPIGVVPFFIHFTQNFTPEQRRRTIRTSALTAFTVIAISALAGLQIITFFGISIASFQVGGGMLLLVSSLHMLNAQPPETRKDELDAGQADADAGASIAVVPLTVPLLTGPATISTMVIYAEKTRTFWEHAVLVGYGVVIAVATLLAFSAAGRIARVLGKVGINVMTRLMGLILAAMAVELLADGLVKLFPILASPALR